MANFYGIEIVEDPNLKPDKFGWRQKGNVCVVDVAPGSDRGFRATWDNGEIVSVEEVEAIHVNPSD